MLQSVGSLRRGDKFNRDPGQCFALIFLQEMPAAGDRHMVAAFGAGDAILEGFFTPACHRVLVRKGGKHRFFELS